MSDLRLVVEDADAEFDALRRLITFSNNALESGRGLPAQAKLVASNASVLFIAAAFEEFVRQLGVAYAKQLVLKHAIPDDRLRSIKMGLWQRATQELTSKQLGTRRFDEAQARIHLSVLKEFCLDVSQLSLMIDHAVYNTRNLRAEELNSLFKRLGVTDVCAKAGRSIEFRGFFLLNSVAAAQGEFTRFLNKFYDDRNAATHDLGAFRAAGSVDVMRQVGFFELSIRRIAAVLEADLTSIA
jgi:hypothetical protein